MRRRGKVRSERLGGRKGAEKGVNAYGTDLATSEFDGHSLLRRSFSCDKPDILKIEGL
jgi:hypothetical protein